MQGLPWQTYEVERKGISQVHCMPAGDLQPHIPSEHCPCQPVEDFDTVDMFMHCSVDGRERHEQGAPLH